MAKKKNDHASAEKETPVNPVETPPPPVEAPETETPLPGENPEGQHEGENAPENAPECATGSKVATSRFTAYAPHKHPDHPDGPDLDPDLGTKTPAFVAYLSNLKK